MKIHKYKDYNEYVEIQIKANKAKLKSTWVMEDTIKYIAKQQKANKILCHGTRNGTEQNLFLKYFPNAYVIGTEISDTAPQFSNTIQHDFHEEQIEWINAFDIVYSNAWDHSYDPDKSLKTWKNQLNNDGCLYLDHTQACKENISRATDPLEIYHDEMLELFEKYNLVLEDTFDFDTQELQCTLYMLKKGKIL